MGETAGQRKRPYAARMAPEQRRTQLLDGVLHVIVTQGVHKVSMDAVAREVGVTRPVMYSLFLDSDDLLRASLEREEQAAVLQIGHLMTVIAERRPPERIAALVDGFLQVVTDAPDRWRAILMLADSSTPAFRKRLDRGRRAFTSALEVLVQSVAADRHDDLDVELVARGIYALLAEAGRQILAESLARERVTAFAASACAAVVSR